MSCRTDIALQCIETTQTSSESEDVSMVFAAATAEKTAIMANFV
jgi:hypothetical protein